MTDTRRQLEQLAERGHPRGADEVIAAARSALDPGQRGLTPVPEPGRRRMPGWAYAAGAAVAATVLIGGAALLFGGGEDDPVATTVAGFDPVAAAEAGPVWSAVPGSGEVFAAGHIPVAALPFRDGYVAAGYTEVDVPRAAVWLSADGSAWWRAEADLGPDTRINGLATNGSVLVAGGTAFDDDPTGFDHAAVWVSADGAAWTRAAHDGAVFPRTSRITAVGFSGRFVALGTVPELEDFGSREPPAVVATWVSDDGTGWRRGAEVPGAESILDVAAGGPGLVAVGAATGEAPGIWVSADGEAWTRVEGLPATDPLDPACELRGLDRVASGPLGWLAAGSCSDPANEQSAKVVLLTSSDGLDWTTAAQPNAEPYATGWVTDVMVTGAGFRAVGIHLTADDAGPAFWYSADGVTWVFQQDAARVQVSAPGERTETLARSEASDLGPGGFLAMGTLVDAGDRLVALGIGGEGGMVWVSERR